MLTTWDPFRDVERLFEVDPRTRSIPAPFDAVRTADEVVLTAYQLALKGHDVTLFDERAELGGMMRYGIPGFRTPRDILDAEIQRILDLGIKTRLNTRIGTDITMAQIRADFDAVFLGLGAQAGRALPVEGSEAPNCVTATSFLKAFNDGRLRHVGKRVVNG